LHQANINRNVPIGYIHYERHTGKRNYRLSGGKKIMRYRVHYKDKKRNDERVVMEIEAASPQGAVIKFRHVHNGGNGDSNSDAEVISVCPIPSPTNMSGIM